MPARVVSRDPVGSLTSALAYEADAPLRPEIERTEEELDVSTSWIRYDGICRRRVTALLVEPIGAAPFPGLIFLHHLGGDKMYFLGEAKQLAGVGIASLLVELPHRRPVPHRLTADIKDPKSVRAYYLQTIGDVRRGYDLLEQLDTIDARRFAFVGRNEGGDLAAAISALEPRAETVVCIGCIARRSVYWKDSESPEAVELRKRLGRMELKRYTRALEEFDAAPLLRRAHAQDWLFQFETDDDRMEEAELEWLKQEAAEGAALELHRTDLSSSEAQAARGRWLESKLRTRRD